MLRQFAIIFGCLAFGELVVFLTRIPVPSSIIGMLLLTLLLEFRIIKLSWVEDLSNFLIKYIGFFFVPPGVGVMLYFDLIKAQWFPILVASIGSTIIVLVVTGWVHQLMRRRK